MVLKDNWETALALDEAGNDVVITRRIGIDEFRQSGKFPFRIDVIYTYTPDGKGMPNEEDSELIGNMEERLRPIMEKDKLAILTGNYLGGGKKYLAFYTRNVDVFFERLNEALDDMPELPLTFEGEEDREWEEYMLMRDFDGITLPEAD